MCRYYCGRDFASAAEARRYRCPSTPPASGSPIALPGLEETDETLDDDEPTAPGGALPRHLTERPYTPAWMRRQLGLP